MTNDENYHAWRSHRRALDLPPELADRIMADVHAQSLSGPVTERMATHANGSSLVPWSACVAALLVGLLPFIFVAYVAELLVF